MTDEAFLRRSFQALEVNEEFSEAALRMHDGSQLHFRHRVGERWVKAAGISETGGDASLAGRVLSRIVTFRLNARHLDVLFADGSRWEARFSDAERVR